MDCKVLLVSDGLSLWRGQQALNGLEHQAWRLGLALGLASGEEMGVERRAPPQGGAEHFRAA